MKTYLADGKYYTEDVVIAIHRMWQDIQDRENISEGIELALTMIGDDEISDYVHSNKPNIIERCLKALPEWVILQDECLSQNCLLDHYLIADKLKELYTYYKERGSLDNVVFQKNGVTSWGATWRWAFGYPVELTASDGHTVLKTYFHTLESEYNFEDKRDDLSYSLSPTQDSEWGDICWNCYQMEFNIYGMIQKSFKSCVSRLILNYKAKHSGLVFCMPDKEFRNMLATCLDTVKEEWNWGEEKLEWLFNYSGPIKNVVEKWLTEALERQGF